MTKATTDRATTTQSMYKTRLHLPRSHLSTTKTYTSTPCVRFYSTKINNRCNRFYVHLLHQLDPPMTDNYTARWNLQMMEKYPNWYDHIDKVEAAIQEQDRIISIRQAAGWELDEGGWMAPDPDNNDNLIPESEWLDYGLLPPEETCDSQETAAP